jgi:molecular chaperone DnaJ
MADKDYYKILGVDRNATKEQIKSAYKKLAKQYHPDVNKEHNAAEKFKEINEAASALGDDQKRQQYDQFGADFERKYHQDFNQNFRGFDFEDMDFGDVFEMFFGGGFGGRRSRQSRGRDLRYDMTITLEEAATGTKKSITLEKPETCPDCDGRGGDDYETCDECNGQGVKRVSQRTPFGIFQSTVTCKKCQGHGEVVKNVCETCEGEGIIHKKKTLEVTIPEGVDSGAQLRLREEGEAIKGGTTGDLYIFIEVKKHKFFDREGDDILIDVPISVTQAILGAEIEVPTLEGRVDLSIPEGTQPETVFKLRNKGIPHLNHHGRGDQLVKVKVQIPDKLTKKQEQIIEEFDKELGKKRSFFERFFE